MSAFGRLLPVTEMISSIGEGPLLGESGHWDASSKSHIHDIRERLLSARSGRSEETTWSYVCELLAALVALRRPRLNAVGLMF